MANLNFYIIYTPGSFALLSMAARSLLHHSPHHYTLVGNGLPAAEMQQLDDFAAQHERVSTVDLPGGVTVPHGTALNHLLQHHQEGYFCFCDSDVFATADFSLSLERAVADNQVFSSCVPLEWTHKTIKPGYRGFNHTSPSGLPLAMTYFAVYQTEPLKQIISKHHISLERYMRQSQVPTHIHALIKPADQHTWKFNTAKLVNLMQATEGMQLAYRELPELLHLGGVSRFSEHSREGTRKAINPDNTVALDRVASRDYFYQLLEGFTHQKLSHRPPCEVTDQAFRKLISTASDQLEKLYRQLQEAVA